MTDGRRHVIVVGGGLAGLVAAYRLTRPESWSGSVGPVVTVLEAASRVGGVIQPLDVDGLDVEGGPDSFVVRKPAAVELCRELGLASELIDPGSSGAYVVARGRLEPYPQDAAFGIPPDAESLLRWPGLSVRGRLRAITDLWRPRRRGTEDESIGALLTRRLGAECARVLVGPLLAGINSGDPDRLSVRATFPELAEWERIHGSLIRGSRAARRRSAGAGSAGADAESAGPGAESAGPGAATGLFASLRGGLSTLVDALGREVGADRIRLDAPAESVMDDSEGQWRVRVHGEGRPIVADAIVLATPAFVTADLIRALAADMAAELDAIPYGSSAVVALAYPPGTGSLLPEGTGFIVPPGAAIGGRTLTITASTWLSRKWPDPRYCDTAVVRAFVGRAGDEAVLERTDAELVALVVHDLDAVVPLGAPPEAAGLMRWPRSMPQYEVGHGERQARISDRAERLPGIALAGSAYGGVGIADVVRGASEAAGRILAHLSAAEVRERTAQHATGGNADG